MTGEASVHLPANDDTLSPAHYHVIYSYSDDGGSTWTEQFLTPHPSAGAPNVPWATDVQPPYGQVVGHYLGMAVAGNKAMPCYTTTQNGTPSNPDSDIFVNVVTR